MSYEKARECFSENINMIGRANAMQRPQEWNLNNGLDSLTVAIQNDLNEVKALLARIVRALEDRR
jgi:hypothetical protein